LEGLAIEDVDTLYGHLVYFAAIWHILWPFDVFFPLWYAVPRKNLATLLSGRHSLFIYNTESPIPRKISL
jgi:hypothetical protein